MRELILVAAVSGSVLLGVSYQVPIWFYPDTPQGYSDTVSYVKMWNGDFSVPIIHRYRPLVPLAARAIHSVSSQLFRSERRAVLMSFYMVNFAFMWAAGILLFYVLRRLQFQPMAGLLGVALFCGSQVTSYIVGLPLVDAPYIWAIAVVGLCYQMRAVRALALVVPLLLLTKETAVPFVFLPLVQKEFRTPIYILSLTVGTGLIMGMHWFVDLRWPLDNVAAEGGASYVGRVVDCLMRIGVHSMALFSMRSVAVVLEAFSFLTFLAIFGGWISFRDRRFQVPLFFRLMIPISVFLAIMSNNYGRMLFAAYVPVLAYALIALEYLMPGGLVSTENDAAVAQ